MPRRDDRASPRTTGFGPLRRLAQGLAAAAGPVAALLVATAPGLGTQTARADEDFLPPEKAYEYAAQADLRAVVVSYNIRSGYYLYRKRIAFASDTPGITLGTAELPKGLPHKDDYFGEQEIYRGTVAIRVPYTVSGTAPSAIDLKLKLQGCADAGLCYPPQNWMTRVRLPVSAPAAASGGAGGGMLGRALGKAAPAGDEFLPVEQAYRISAEAGGPDEVRVHFAIADGYYLYRHRMAVRSDDTRLVVGTVALPAGLPHEDAYFGAQQIYRQAVEATVPVRRSVAAAGTYQIGITYQGCADAGLCYPPQTAILSVDLPAGGVAAATVNADPGRATLAPGAAVPALAALLGFALLGGLLLNLMPCVLPVLSIKAVSLAAAADGNAAGTRAKGFAYTAGVVLSMLTLAGVLLGLRAVGEQIGWGFQLQSPAFVLGLCYLLLLVGLNLSGVFEVGASLAGAGDGLTRGDGARASFFTGILTTLVATPCTAPFMATAVGVALTQSPAAALAVFAALGVGLALPYLWLSLAPGARRFLPKPGAWMTHFKQALAFPMYASAGWLLWVLAQQASPPQLAAAIGGLILVGLAAWCYELSKTTRPSWRYANLAIALLAVGTACAVPVALRGATAATHHLADDPLAGGWEAFDAGRVEALVAAGRPVFVVFTADWCVTCKVNEQVAIETDEMQRLFRAKHVALIKGDWTNQDGAISRELARHGRAGVPLYLFYRPHAATPEILPQILAPGTLRERVQGLPDSGQAT